MNRLRPDLQETVGRSQNVQYLWLLLIFIREASKNALTASRRVEYLTTNLESARRGPVKTEEERWLRDLATAAGMIPLGPSL